QTDGGLPAPAAGGGQPHPGRGPGRPCRPPRRGAGAGRETPRPGRARASVNDDVLTVVLVDDHQLFSRGLELLLNTDPESRVRVLARTEDADKAVELVRHHQPKVAIIDLVMPPPGGLAAVAAVKRNYPQVKVLALS